MYDFVIVGAGLFGAVFARQVTDAGAKCLVVDRREHLGGNCFTRDDGGIHVHEYGPHIFHTNSEKVWSYMHRWASFNHFVNRPRVCFGERIYSFPINLLTMYQLWGVKTPSEAQERLAAARVPCDQPRNLEEWILSQVGQEIYETFVKGYTTKQWGRHPRDLPAFIIKRLPIRSTYDDNYYSDRYQGIPTEGYTEIFRRLLEGVPVKVGVDYLRDRSALDKLARRVVYTGALDELFEYDLGPLEWRSLRFEHERLSVPDYQGVAVVNYTAETVPFTRSVEHKHFTFGTQDHTVVTREYPQSWSPSQERYYPVNDEKNKALYQRYRQRVDETRFILGGRLADYQYYDMHQVVASALVRSERTLMDGT